ncbi:MAG: VIT1/CCC1 transporter family protein [Chloroflexi bacterium]|nr:VIT1/CCC1 transporter family protein [Chloroflexota bacterium]
MTDSQRVTMYRMYLEGELEAAAMYEAMAKAEADPQRAEVFRQLVQAEMRHASRWAQKLGIDQATLAPARGGIRLRSLSWAARRFGTHRVVPLLLRGESKDIGNYSLDSEAYDLAKEERNHGRILRGLTGDNDPLETIRAESWQYGGTSGKLRAAVMGANDGLVSNFSLVMGVAGGTSDPGIILLAGVAGLLAGAFSMAAGEYVSVRSQRDMYEHQIHMERAEIQMWPEEEEEELTLIYQAKGLSKEEARVIAKRVMADPAVTLDTMVREELGLNPFELGSPWGAAISSFATFVAGALVPIIPYLLGADTLGILLSTILTAVALLAVGGTLAWMAGRNIAWGAMRMILIAGAAAAVTFGVGSLIGVSLSA